MSKKNEKMKAEMKNDIRRTVKQDKIRVQIHKKRLIKTAIVLSVIAFIAALVVFIIMQRKVKVKDEDVNIYNYFLYEENGLNGVINKDGKVVINATYEYIQIPNPEKPIFICFYDYNDEIGDYQTKVINDKEEALFTQFSNVRAIPRNDTSKSYLFQNNILTYEEQGKRGIVTIDERKVTAPIYDSVETLEHKDGILRISKDGNLGLIKLNGDTIIKPKYYSIYSDGYYDDKTQYENAGFIVGIKTDEGYRFGYLNSKGKEILECKYSAIRRILEIKNDEAAYLITSQNGKIGLNRNIQVKIKNEYEEIEYDPINKIVSIEKNGKYGISDLDGNLILPTQYESLQFAGKIITATKDGNQLAFDANGNIQKEFKYVAVNPTKSENYFITVTADGKHGISDNNNDVLVDNKYDYIEYAFDNYFIFSNDGKSGIMDNTGRKIINNDLDVVQHINGTNIIQAIDSTNSKSFILNKNIKKVLEVVDAHLFIQNNYIKIVSPNTLVYLDYDGNIKEASEVFGGNAIYAKEEDGKWGYVNSSGNVIIDYQYDLALDLNEYGYGAIKKDGKWGCINSKGEFIVDPIYEIKDIEPTFIGEYYRTSENYEVSVFVKK